jgi:hypothetical protein
LPCCIGQGGWAVLLILPGTYRYLHEFGSHRHRRHYRQRFGCESLEDLTTSLRVKIFLACIVILFLPGVGHGAAAQDASNE